MPVSPKQITKPTTIGASTLRTIVKESCKQDEENTMDLNGILWLEHINLVVGDEKQAEYFYQDVLGCTRDLDAKFHVNMGQQQFHLAQGDTQRIYGSVGLVVPNLKTVRGRISGTEIDVMEDNEEEGYMSIKCPWGNIFHLYCTQHDKAALLEDMSISKKMVRLHKSGGAYSSDSISVRGKPGIRFIELVCPKGSIPSIQHLYESLFGCNVSSFHDKDTLSICVGPGVHLVYVEQDIDNGLKDLMEGVHIGIYVQNFKALYDNLSGQNLIWTNPRFVHLDTCDTWEEARDSRTLRFKDIVDLSCGEKIMELEHEVRPARHGQFMKVPYYVPK